MDNNDVYMVDSIPVAYQAMGLYEGHIPICPMKLETPVLNWKGAKIDKILWEQIVSFMRWTYRKFKSEAQLRLYYNDIHNKWGVAVLPQEVNTGLSSKELADHPNRREVLDKFPPVAGWREAGTVHHHCSTGAFQSGTDLNDEKDKNGLHITLGDMESDTAHSFHARVSFRKVMYPAKAEQWVELSFVDKPTNFTVYGNCTYVPDTRRHFPNEWKKFLVPKVYAPVTSSRFGGNSTGYSGYGYHDYDDMNGEEGFGYGRVTSASTVSSVTPLAKTKVNAIENWAAVLDSFRYDVGTLEPEEIHDMLDAATDICKILNRFESSQKTKSIADYSDILSMASDFQLNGLNFTWGEIQDMERVIPVLKKSGFFGMTADERFEYAEELEKTNGNAAQVSGRSIPPVGGGFVQVPGGFRC